MQELYGKRDKMSLVYILVDDSPADDITVFSKSNGKITELLIIVYFDFKVVFRIDKSYTAP